MHVACPHCQSTVQVDDQFSGQTTRCPLCGGEFRVPSPVAGEMPLPPTGGGVPGTVRTTTVARLALAAVAISLGQFGLHKFILGRTIEGLIMLAGTLVSCCILSPVIWIIGIIEGIIYLLKSDREFEQDYLIDGKGWF